jgi:hypothetical protein
MGEHTLDRLNSLAFTEEEFHSVGFYEDKSKQG